jgi:hypothetical protein
MLDGGFKWIHSSSDITSNIYLLKLSLDHNPLFFPITTNAS